MNKKHFTRTQSLRSVLREQESSLDIVKDKTFTEIEADPEIPFLPVHMMSIHRKTWTLRLDNVQRLHASPHTNLSFCKLLCEVWHSQGDFRNLRKTEIFRLVIYWLFRGKNLMIGERRFAFEVGNDAPMICNYNEWGCDKVVLSMPYSTRFWWFSMSRKNVAKRIKIDTATSEKLDYAIYLFEAM